MFCDGASARTQSRTQSIGATGPGLRQNKWPIKHGRKRYLQAGEKTGIMTRAVEGMQRFSAALKNRVRVLQSLILAFTSPPPRLHPDSSISLEIHLDRVHQDHWWPSSASILYQRFLNLLQRGGIFPCRMSQHLEHPFLTSLPIVLMPCSMLRCSLSRDLIFSSVAQPARSLIHSINGNISDSR